MLCWDILQWFGEFVQAVRRQDVGFDSPLIDTVLEIMIQISIYELRTQGKKSAFLERLTSIAVYQELH